MRQIFELGPLVVFFYFFVKTGEIQQAIMPLMIAAVIAIIGSYIFEKKVSPMLIFSTALILIFGSLTIYFNDPFFIKFKVTLVNLIFSIILFGGLYVIKVRKKYNAHDENNKFKNGDKVSIVESKPFSKNKKFQVMENNK